MESTNQMKSGFAGEIAIVPVWAWILGGLGFIAAQILFDFVIPYQDDGPPFPLELIMGVAAGFILATYLLFIGYVSCDARHRGMSSFLWTAVTIFVPNGLGIILYFIMRQPKGPRQSIATLGSHVSGAAHICPSCACTISHCPACGTSLTGPA